ncbi:hypothetical protein MHYP_G00042330 [Metynnis hypsauchen]
MTPLPCDALEFKDMPKNVCMTCGTSVPLQLLPFHTESCQLDDDSGYVAEEQPNQETDVICMDSCPVCGEQFAAEIMPYHASSRGESFPPMNSTMMNRNVTEEVHHYQWLLHLKTVLLAFALLAQQNRGRGPKFHNAA